MSKTIDDGGPAFPSNEMIEETGMTLRDWFAGQAMAGMVSSKDIISACIKAAYHDGVDPTDIVAADAYTYADAMLAERNK